jgi:hypothetical protein
MLLIQKYLNEQSIASGCVSVKGAPALFVTPILPESDARELMISLCRLITERFTSSASLLSRSLHARLLCAV